MNPATPHIRSLEDLREIAPPLPVSYWPQTWGWLLLGVLVAAFVLWAVWRAYRRYRAQAWRREAFRELGSIAVALDNGEPSRTALANLPALVKRVALATASRQEVAGLSGSDWLTWLGKTGQAEAFAYGPGALLPDLAYGRRDIASEEARALVGVIRDWIGRRHAQP